jgi:hypothetical protein
VIEQRKAIDLNSRDDKNKDASDGRKDAIKLGCEFNIEKSVILPP